MIEFLQPLRMALASGFSGTATEISAHTGLGMNRVFDCLRELVAVRHASVLVDNSRSGAAMRIYSASPRLLDWLASGDPDPVFEGSIRLSALARRTDLEVQWHRVVGPAAEALHV